MNRRTLVVVALLALSTVCASTLAAATAKTSRGLIAFSAQVHGVSQVFTVRPDGTGLRQVTHDASGAGDYGLTWSPDGRSLLYTSDGNGKDRVGEMVRSNADGSGATVVSPSCTGTCLGDNNPDYSPDGTKIAFERAFGPVVNDNASGGVAVFTVNSDGSGPTQLTPKDTSVNGQARWSPDGTEIAFVHVDEALNQGAIETMSPEGNNVRRLTRYGIDATDPRWSPNGKRILFSDYADPVQSKSANLFTMRADGTHRVQLTHYSGGTLQAFALDWSPDGRQILFRLMAYSGTDTEVGGYYILNLRTKHVRRLTSVRIRHDVQAAWGK